MDKLLDRLRVPEPETTKLLVLTDHPYVAAALTALWLIVVMLVRVMPLVVLALTGKALIS